MIFLATTRLPAATHCSANPAGLHAEGMATGGIEIDPRLASNTPAPAYVSPHTYLRSMKTKLTLSIDRRKVAKLRKASERKGTSISGLVANLADKLDDEPAQETEPGIRKWLGTLDLKPEDFEEDSRAGAELRKTEAYERMKAKRKRA